jgi:hypothetical protein
VDENSDVGANNQIKRALNRADSKSISETLAISISNTAAVS